jgi:hypothetical protein
MIQYSSFPTYAASCQVIELSSKSVQDSDESETGVQLSDESATGVQLADVSESGVQLSLVSGMAPQPNPIITPTAQIDSTPVIPMDTTLPTVPTACASDSSDVLERNNLCAHRADSASRCIACDGRGAGDANRVNSASRGIASQVNCNRLSDTANRQG